MSGYKEGSATTMHDRVFPQIQEVLSFLRDATNVRCEAGIGTELQMFT